MCPAKMDELIEMPFGGRTHVGPWNHVLDGIHIGATWRIRLNDPCLAVMQAVTTTTVVTCLLLLLNNQ